MKLDTVRETASPGGASDCPSSGHLEMTLVLDGRARFQAPRVASFANLRWVGEVVSHYLAER